MVDPAGFVRSREGHAGITPTGRPSASATATPAEPSLCCRVRQNAGVVQRQLAVHALFTGSDLTSDGPSTPGWPAVADGIPLADPVQQWADLFELGGEDRREAAERLRRAILDRTIGKVA